jgi:hypothetical protein
MKYQNQLAEELIPLLEAGNTGCPLNAFIIFLL